MKQEEDGRDGTERPKTRGNKKYNITHLVGSKKREKFKVIALPRGFFTWNSLRRNDEIDEDREKKTVGWNFNNELKPKPKSPYLDIDVTSKCK